MTIQEFAVANKRRLVAVLAVLLLLGVSFLAGRHSVRVSTEVRKTDTKTDTTKLFTQEQLDSAVRVAVQKSEQEHVHRVVREIDRKDGTKVKTITYDRQDNKQSQSETVKVVHDVKIQVVERIVTDTKTYEKIVKAPLPQWKLSLMAGTDFGALRLSGSVPYVNPLLLGLHLDRRIAGPFFLGAWGLTDTSFKAKLAGLSLGFEW